MGIPCTIITRMNRVPVRRSLPLSLPPQHSPQSSTLQSQTYGRAGSGYPPPSQLSERTQR
ncbi:hypothetical protein BS47DRAFT_1348264 [Hydnum rufescens UP504]|uniref:Uncharacterized protein n=1 Tax=Hydnum rufescens UP504 TaxID=1448309 RepID=A0A9P6AR66_9AGAM|nr:hypothetical protein BS47DRAFT_1348264 [Hydnum rufescens UP504]